MKRPPNRKAAGGKETSPEARLPAQNYEVGYRKPPVQKRFKPGQSGNPKGRPAGEPYDPRKVLGGILEQRVTIKDQNGRRYTITKLEVAVTQLLNKAAKGDLAALRPLIGVVHLVYGKELPPPQQRVNFIIEG